MWSAWLAITAMLLPCCHSASFSSWPVSRKYLYGLSSVAERLTGVSRMICQLACVSHGSCRSFNYHDSGGTCEILAATICDSDSYYLTASSGGSSWFDVVEPATLTHLKLWNTPVCSDGGRCRDECLRQVGASCVHSAQCNHGVTGAATCVSGQCQCDPDFWPYNQTLCLRRNERARTEGTHWAWKKVVNGACTVEFEVKAGGEVHLSLRDKYLFETTLYSMHIAVPGAIANYAERVNPGVSTYTFGTNPDLYPLDPSNYQHFIVTWCGGRINLYRPGIVTFFYWEDPSPIPVTYIAFKGEEARWKFTSNVVDPWFGDWTDDRVYELPQYSAMLRRQDLPTFTVVFECSASTDCNWVAGEAVRWTNSNKYNIYIGGSANTKCHIYREFEDGSSTSLAVADSVNIVTRAELRKFRIEFNEGGFIAVYRGDETAPLMTATDPDPFTINFDGPRNRFDPGNMFLRLVKYDASWSYEQGYKYNSDLGQ